MTAAYKNFVKLGPGWPSAGWAEMDCREGKVLTGKFLVPRFASVALSLKGVRSNICTDTVFSDCADCIERTLMTC